MDCSLPGSSIHGIFQARVLEWVTISFSRGSSWPQDQTWVSRIAGRHFTIWAMVFPIVMYGCESWTIKKAERWRIDAFELWCWRRLLRVPWTARRSNHSILKEISPENNWKDWCWSWNSNTLASCCEGLTHLKRPWCWERLKAGGEGDDRGWDGWMTSLTQWTWVWASSGRWWRTGSLVCCSSWDYKELDTAELNWIVVVWGLRPGNGRAEELRAGQALE